jgi:thiol-disulfide isomerase/thioredoxin
MKAIAVIIILIIGLDYSAFSTSDTLKIGDKAPNLYIQEWIKGKPIKQFEPGKFYLIEFSAVECAGCRLAIPHLSAIAQKYKGRLEVISVYNWQTNPNDVKDLRGIQQIKKFVNVMSDKIAYSLAADVPQRYTFQKWVTASGMSSIPTAFLVDGKGQIVWFDAAGKIEPIIEAAFSEKYKEAIEEARKKIDQNDEAIAATITEIFKLKKAGRMNIALAKMDSLMETYPNRAFYYKKKFELLAGVDDGMAYDCLQWILDNQGVENYDWYHLIYKAYAYSKKPNYSLAHQVADRAIVQAETNSLKAFSMLEKSRIYDLEGNLSAAIDCCSKAVETAKKDSIYPREDLKVFEDNLKYFKEKLEKSN